MLRSRILSPRQFQRIGFPCRYESTTVNASPETETKTPKKQKNVAKVISIPFNNKIFTAINEALCLASQKGRFNKALDFFFWSGYKFEGG